MSTSESRANNWWALINSLINKTVLEAQQQNDSLPPLSSNTIIINDKRRTNNIKKLKA